jgi:tetratricopeptide (TPR) repeat protein
MSRSIHETRRQWRELRRAQFSDPREKRRALRAVARRVLTKRDIKQMVQVQRRDAGLSLLPSLTDLIPIHVIGRGPYIHHPANETDLRNVMRALPKGVLDGLSEIELRLEASSRKPKGEADPFTGRLGFEMLPGMYSSHVYGVYNHDGKIALSAYVYDPAIPNCDALELYLRLRALSTFVHEVAHRFDQTSRIARGRWRMDDREKNEVYAEDFEHQWTQTIVVPYLERAYPHQVEALQAWVQFHGGVRVELIDLLEHGRAASKAEHKALSSFFSGRRAFEGLVENVAGRLSRNETRIDYARSLHYAELYDLALEALDGVLLESPNEPDAFVLEALVLEALVLKADIKVHQREFGAARRLADAALREDSIHLDALIVLCDALEGLRDWSKLHSVALRTCNHDELLAYQLRDALLHLAQANLELGHHETARENIIELDDLDARQKRTLNCRKLAWLKTELATRGRSKFRKVQP